MLDFPRYLRLLECFFSTENWTKKMGLHLSIWSPPSSLWLDFPYALGPWEPETSPKPPIATVDGSEIPNNHLGCIKAYTYWDKQSTNHCSSTVDLILLNHVEAPKKKILQVLADRQNLTSFIFASAQVRLRWSESCFTGLSPWPQSPKWEGHQIITFYGKTYHCSTMGKKENH